MEVTIREIDVVLTKVNIVPGDVLVVSVPNRLRTESAVNIQKTFESAFGVPAIVLQDGMKLDCVLSVDETCLRRAADQKLEADDRLVESIQKTAIGNKVKFREFT